MKVGTDGVLLGAWAPMSGAGRILDVGTGCGIIALMLAQRTEGRDCQIDAIEIELNAAQQAYENFEASPWPDRLPRKSEHIHCSLQEFSCSEVNHGVFDLIVCNPPFFTNSYLPSNSGRRLARHSEELAIETLFLESTRVLSNEGRLCLVFPSDQSGSAVDSACRLGMNLTREVHVRPNPSASAKRVLLEFTLSESCQRPEKTELILEQERHVHTPEFASLVEDFHLRYASSGL